MQKLQCRSQQPVKWIGSGKRDIDAVPDGVKDVFGHAIDLAQAGGNQITRFFVLVPMTDSKAFPRTVAPQI